MIALNISITAFYAFVGLLMLVATCIVPTDRTVFESLKITNNGGTYEAKDDEKYCMYCIAFSKASSKHWGQCNRWVHNFDHHCKWLSNWIGDRNYKWFIALVISFWVVTFAIFLTWIVSLSGIHTNSNIATSQNFDDFYNLESSGSGETVAYAFIWVLLTLSVVKLAFATHLLWFQIYVKSQGLSTYQYVLKQREKKLK